MICYTVITNGYDTLKEPTVVTPGWQYVCFSDRKIESNVWEFREIENKKNADREVKILGHEFLSGITLYVDGSMRIEGDLNHFVYGASTTWTMRMHRNRNCTYHEGMNAARKWNGLADSVSAQMDRYRSEGFPESWGLGANGILLRDFSRSEVRKINQSWWEEYSKESTRDQLSLMYCFWKAKWRPDFLPSHRFSLCFKKEKHVEN